MPCGIAAWNRGCFGPKSLWPIAYGTGVKTMRCFSLLLLQATTFKLYAIISHQLFYFYAS